MKDFKKYYTIQATAEEIYTALTNPFTIELWTGYKAEMPAETGGEFSMYDGDISGIIMELEINKKIVQQWFFGEESDNSIVKIILHESGTKTSVEVHHSNIPDQDYDQIVYGWNEYIIGGLKDFFEEE